MTSSVIIDISLLCILIISAIIGACRGLIKSVGNFIVYILSFMIANSFYTVGDMWISKLKFLVDMRGNTVCEELDAMSHSTFCDKTRFILSKLTKTDLGTILNSGNSEIKYYCSELISGLISFIIIFIISLILLKLLLLIINKAFEAPVLKQINKTLGFVFGILVGLFAAWLVANLFSGILLPFFIERWPETFNTGMLDSTVLQLFTKYNPITYLVIVLNWITKLFMGH